MSEILVIGGTGTIGSAVVDRLSDDHDVIAVGHTSGDYQVDIADKASIQSLFDQVGEVDHLVSAAGDAAFGPFDDLDDEAYQVSVDNKLMGQVNLVRVGRHFVTDDGSVTLTSGYLAENPIKGSAAISMVNAGLQGFVRAAGLELDGNPRVNVVSPPWVAETLEAMGRDPSRGAPAATVAEAFALAIGGEKNGEVIPVS